MIENEFVPLTYTHTHTHAFLEQQKEFRPLSPRHRTTITRNFINTFKKRKKNQKPPTTNKMFGFAARIFTKNFKENNTQNGKTIKYTRKPFCTNAKNWIFFSFFSFKPKDIYIYIKRSTREERKKQKTTRIFWVQNCRNAIFTCSVELK